MGGEGTPEVLPPGSMGRGGRLRRDWEGRGGCVGRGFLAEGTRDSVPTGTRMWLRGGDLGRGGREGSFLSLA